MASWNGFCPAASITPMSLNWAGTLPVMAALRDAPCIAVVWAAAKLVAAPSASPSLTARADSVASAWACDTDPARTACDAKSCACENRRVAA